MTVYVPNLSEKEDSLLHLAYYSVYVVDSSLMRHGNKKTLGAEGAYTEYTASDQRQ